MFKDLFTQNTDFSMVLANYLRPIVMYGAESRLKGEPVTSLRCVGCGHCVDACKPKTLSYTTTFLTKIYNK